MEACGSSGCERGAPEILAAARMADQHLELARLHNAPGIRMNDQCNPRPEYRTRRSGPPGSSSTRWNALSSRSVQLYEVTMSPIYACTTSVPLRSPVLVSVISACGVRLGERAGIRNVGDRPARHMQKSCSSGPRRGECQVLRKISVTVAVLAADLVVVDRQLACVAREGDREPAARVGLAQNDLRNGLSALHAGVRRPHEREDVPSAADSSTITPLVPITHAGITCGLELMSTTTSGLPVSLATLDSSSSSAFWPPAIPRWRWSRSRRPAAPHRPRPRPPDR